MAEGPASERRRSERIPSRSLVELRLPTWNTLRDVYTVNLSLGGMRLSLGGGRPPLGAAVDIILTLPNGERLHLAGTIAHLGNDTSGDIGIRFDPLSPRTEEEMRRYIEAVSEGRAPDDKAMRRSIPPGVLIKKT